MSRVKDRPKTSTRNGGGTIRRGGALRHVPGGSGGRLGKVGLILGVLLAIAAEIWAAPLVYPLRLFTVLLHEGGHAVVALLTGGRVVEIAVRAEESGHTLTQGGLPLLILNGGYLGSLTAGLLLAATPSTARGPAVMLGLLAFAALWWIPLFSFGFVYTAVVGGLLCLLGVKGSHSTARLVLRGLGVFVAADALRDILSDLGRGDAELLANLTLVPAPVWSVAWLIAALSVLVWAVRRA